MAIHRLVLAVLGILGSCLFASSPAVTQNFPDRPIKIVVPFPPGGPTDVAARLVAQNISASLGQPVVIENRAGAGGTLGAKAVASADPDGYTLLFGSTSSLAIAPAIYKTLDYDPVKDFAPIATVSDAPFILVTSSGFPATSLKELIAYAKANPGKVNYASAGIGTPPHLTGEMFKAATGTNIVHVPYKGGAPAITDVIAGQVEMTFETTSVLLPLVKEGKVRALAVTSAHRRPELPDTPNMIESGFPGFLSNSWTGVVAPAGTPAGIISKLNAAINAGLTSEATKVSFAKLGLDPRVGSPENFASLIASETKKWTEIAKLPGARID
jgi:tripartite-type tricarboxylate transporter receptor subunit TctC